MRNITTFNLFALVMFILTMGGLAVGLAHEGMQYMSEGFGLHPAVAFPMATIALLVILPTVHWLTCD
jgi:hypothetical protein